jgi:hypothetical protein
MAEQVKKSSSSGSLTSWMTTSSATSTTGNSDKMNDSWRKNRGITTPFRYTRKETKSFQIDRSGGENCSIITTEPPETSSQTKHKKENSSPIGPTCPPTDLYDKNPKNDDDKNNNDNDDLGSMTSHADEGNDDVSINLATFNKTTNLQSSQE